MKILKIGGRNLASLAGDFCVDFEQEPLASSGLFAISGPTGAGKSTLLDALCLALYDATPRLLKINRTGSFLPDVGIDTVSAQDPRNLLRRGAAEAYAEVDFIGNDMLRYRARWSVRRSRGKAGGRLQDSLLTLHRLPELIALGGTKTEVAFEIAQRIGLSFEQFTRAVLLAQNEFSAFLKTEENERGALLETLTGSTIYSIISKRAFERYKAEQAAMQQLSARLADQTPLAQEARATLDAHSAAADSALSAIDARRAVLEQQLRWHQEADKLRQNQALAEQALAACMAQLEAAGERRRRLATVEAVQPARALVAEAARLAAEEAGLQAALATGADALGQATAARAGAGAALAEALARLQAADEAQRAAAPLLDQAKALDASIAALAPSHAQASEARAAATRDDLAAQGALAALEADLAATRTAHASGAAWLAQHAHWEALATQWPRWDTLFAQAGQAAALDRLAQDTLADAQARLLAAADDDATAAQAVAASAQQLQDMEAARQQAIAALAAFDADQLRSERQALDMRRDSLAGAERIWTELAALRSRLQQANALAAHLKAARVSAQAALDAAVAHAPALAAALAQAERSLKIAELACADNVVDLRSTLADDQPCPVCGSAEHPYQHQDAGLKALLGGLVAEVERCRLDLQANLSDQAAQRATVAASDERLAATTRDCGALDASLAQLSQAWDTHALAVEAPLEAERGAWFAAQAASHKARSQELDALQQAERRAAIARDAAQAACDKAQADHAALTARATAARTALAQANAVQQALTDKRALAAASLASLLDQLDAAAADSGWRSAWHGDPAAYRAARALEVGQWRDQATLHAGRTARIATLDIELGGAVQRRQQAAHMATAAEAQFARVDADIGAKRLQRAALWDGKPAREVEVALADAIDSARSAVATQQAAGQQATHMETRAREALAHAETRLAAVSAASAGQQQRLAAWLAAFAHVHPGLDPVADASQLADMLAPDADWMRQERLALQTLDAAASGAQAVLAERRAQGELHRHSAPPDASGSADTLALAQEALLAERKTAHDAAVALRLRVLQDNVRREQAQAMMADVEKQQLVERRWGKLSELIGSSDGKKFRNYAQQFTLDVLLGYANSHLSQLARRYRLERVVNANGPSLGLLVRDQDMGGEIRSVNSLSGGESFLVSLALALGLASLSSNRVRVESLFIDEGFGSLDSDTLRVAMDALDGLQSLGRKVGVISHVQEMTERIAAKILVQPSGGGSSSVTVQ